MTSKELLNKLSQHPMVNTLVSVILGAVLGFFLDGATVAHDYIAYNDIDDLLQNYFVNTGYADQSILELDGVDKQFKELKSTMDSFSDCLETTLTNLGYSSDKVSGMSVDNILDKVPSLALETFNENTNYSNRVNTLNEEISNLKEQNKAYSEQITADVISAKLIIDGEQINSGNTIKNTVAVVDGNAYYSETLLGTYVLDAPIRYSTEYNTIIVGNQAPEKVKFSWDDMVSDSYGINYYSPLDGKIFSMAKTDYAEGIVLGNSDYFYIQTNGKYSSLSFTYGHLDGSEQVDLTLTILAMDESGETYSKVLETVTLTGEMRPKTKTINIAYTDAIKIIASYNGYSSAQYGIVDFYFYS